VCVILFIISLIVTSITIYLVKNSHFYRDEEPIKLPLGLWILILIVLFIPIANIVACVIYIIGLMDLYSENEIELNEDFWLMKKY
jgi:hypothetical protein